MHDEHVLTSITIVVDWLAKIQLRKKQVLKRDLWGTTQAYFFNMLQTSQVQNKQEWPGVGSLVVLVVPLGLEWYGIVVLSSQGMSVLRL